MAIRVYISAHYSTCCFCYNPELVPVTTEYKPSFHWHKGVKAFAKKNGLHSISFGKGKTASAILPVPCRHQQEQRVRFDWSLPIKNWGH